MGFPRLYISYVYFSPLSFRVTFNRRIGILMSRTTIIKRTWIIPDAVAEVFLKLCYDAKIEMSAEIHEQLKLRAENTAKAT